MHECVALETNLSLNLFVGQKKKRFCCYVLHICPQQVQYNIKKYKACTR